jgi:hypothetical protein
MRTPRLTHPPLPPLRAQVTPTVAEIAAKGWNVSVPLGSAVEARNAQYNAVTHPEQAKKRSIGLGGWLSLPALPAASWPHGGACIWRRPEARQRVRACLVALEERRLPQHHVAVGPAVGPAAAP